MIVNAEAPTALLGWAVEPTPVLRIIAGADSVGLFDVVDAAFLSDGRVVVANGGTSQVMIFAPDGGIETTAGGEGDGPGEFREIATLQVAANDTIFVFDESHQRLSVLDPRGAFVRSANVGIGGEPAGGAGRLTVGVAFARERGAVLPGGKDGLQKDSVRYVLLAEQGGALSVGESVTTVPGPITATVEIRGERLYRPAPFSPSAMNAMYRRCLYVASGHGYDVAVFDAAGSWVAEVRNPWSRRSLSEDHREAWTDAMVARRAYQPRAEAALRALIAETPMPDSLPSFSTIVAGPEGYLWAQLFGSPLGASDSLVVFGAKGRLLGLVKLPRKLDVMDVTRDRIVGVVRGAAGEEVIEVYAFERGGEGAEPWPECGVAAGP